MAKIVTHHRRVNRSSRGSAIMVFVVIIGLMVILQRFLIDGTASYMYQDTLGIVSSPSSEAATTTMLMDEDWYHTMLKSNNAKCNHSSTFFEYFLPHKQCQSVVKYGRCRDGAKYVCADLLEGRNTKRAARRGEKCVVYSFGSSDDSCFENAVVQNLDCEIHIFDPTSKEIHHPKWTYHSYGLTGYNPAVTDFWNWRTQGLDRCENCPMKNLRVIMEELRHTHIDILKVDIDGAEWRSFEFIYEVMKTLPADQVQIEVTGLDVTPLRDSLAGGLHGAFELYKNMIQDGFKVFHIEPNWGTCRYRRKERSVSSEYAFWRGL